MAMLNPLRLIGRGLALWWYEFVPVLLAGFVWLVLTLLIITAAPATAVVFALMRDTSQHLYWSHQDVWRYLKQTFWVSWAWALLNGFVIGIIAVNLVFYAGETGWGWLLIRLLWLSVLTAWLTMNLFFWPFWLAQTDRRLHLVWLNCLRFVFSQPLAALGIFLFTAVVLVFSLVTVMPLAFGVLPFLAFISLTAVEKVLTPPPAPPAASTTGHN